MLGRRAVAVELAIWLLISAIETGLKLLPPSEETSTLIRLGLKLAIGMAVLTSMLAHET